MIDFKVFQALVQYSMVFVVVFIMLYIGTSFFIATTGEIKNKWLNFIINESHTIARAVLLIFLGFYIVQFMALVALDAKAFFELYPNSNTSDFFRYIVRKGLG